MSPINWFKILAHTDYTASVTIHVPADSDAHMGDEMQLAVEAAVKSNLAYVNYPLMLRAITIHTPT